SCHSPRPPSQATPPAEPFRSKPAGCCPAVASANSNPPPQECAPDRKPWCPHPLQSTAPSDHSSALPPTPLKPALPDACTRSCPSSSLNYVISIPAPPISIQQKSPRPTHRHLRK